jgi:maltose/moltooligosaccharide transporter
MTTAAAGAPALEKDRYTVGTLHYTKFGLFAVFGWLLWGGFVFMLMETVRPTIFPLFMLKTMGASNTAFYIIMTIIPNIFGVVIGPAVSFKSDRHRGPHGRRIPYIIWTAPFLIIGLVGMGFGPFFLGLFQVSRVTEHLHLHPIMATLAIISFFALLFAFMDEFVNSVFWYLFADVVPEAFLGRFLALFRLVGTGAGALFNWLIFPYAEDHMQAIFTGIGLLYLVGMTVMCLMVKEGQYPPPDDLGESPSILKQVAVFVTECFGHPIYWLLFGYTMCKAVAMVTATGAVIFVNEGIGLTLGQIGAVAAIMNVVGMLLQYPSGWIVDKFHALRVMLLVQLFVAPFQFAIFFFMRDYATYFAAEAARLMIFTLLNAAEIPMYIVIFPKDKFGQFCSCNGMMKSLAILLSAFGAGLFMDYVTANNTDKFAFRWLYAWGGVFQGAAVFCLVAVYLLWKKRGGDAGYVAPGSALEKEMLAKAGAAAQA